MASLLGGINELLNINHGTLAFLQKPGVNSSVVEIGECGNFPGRQLVWRVNPKTGDNCTNILGTLTSNT